MLTQKTRQTRQGEIERTIHVERTDALRATITETRQLKTKTTSTSTAYRLRRFDSEIGGIGVEVVKLDGSGEVFDVLLDGNLSTCTWKWAKSFCASRNVSWTRSEAPPLARGSGSNSRSASSSR
jgi:hypothetical protein